MSQARQQMVMRARVLRPGGLESDGRDEWGGELADDVPDAWIESLPCLAWAPTDAREILDDVKLGVFGAVMLSVPADTDIREGDIIESVTDRRGGEIFPGPLAVVGVTRRASHLAVMARAQKSLRSGGV